KSIVNTTEQIDPNQFLDISKLKTHQNSFYNPAQVIYSNTDIALFNVSLTGHILVQSKTKITVDFSSTLKDVILIAPIIEIKAESKGTFQAFATKEINIGENGCFEYPSAFVLMEDTKYKQPDESIGNDIETPLIKIDKGSN